MDYAHNTGLFLHIIGITLIAGGFLGSIVAERLLWQYLQQEQAGLAAVVTPLLKRYPPMIQAGSVLMLLSGLLMLWSVQWGYWGQTWLSVKLVLYVLLTLNGALVAGPTQAKLVGLLVTPKRPTDFPESLRLALVPVRRRMRLFLLSEAAMLLAVYVLSVYKPH